MWSAMELWFTEKQLTEKEENTVTFSVRIKDLLYRGSSEFQEIAVYDTYEFGRMLVLDNIIQLTEADEFIYHEMMAHIPLCAHPAPERVLVVGGGDGGTVREVCKHPGVRKVVLAELDPQVVEVSRKYLPTLSAALEDTRVEIEYGNGVEYAASQKDAFDIAIIDSPDPLGAASVLFEEKFYRAVFQALKDRGIMTAQCESPFYNRRFIRRVAHTLQGIFPYFKYYLAPVPTYPGGLWGFAAASRGLDPAEILNPFSPPGARYYTARIHQGAFQLPPFVRGIFREEED